LKNSANSAKMGANRSDVINEVSRSARGAPCSLTHRFRGADPDQPSLRRIRKLADQALETAQSTFASCTPHSGTGAQGGHVHLHDKVLKEAVCQPRVAGLGFSAFTTIEGTRSDRLHATLTLKIRTAGAAFANEWGSPFRGGARLRG